MLSSDARQVARVVAAFVAGAALAWTPLSSTSLPFRATSIYPVWAFLIATVCGSCPLVWSHGRRALAQLPAHRRFIRETLAYCALAVALIVTSLAVAPVVYGRGRPVRTLPYLPARFAILFLAVVLAIAPSIMAMARVGDAARHGDVRASNLVTWRGVLQSQLAALGAIIALGTLTTASFRIAILAAYPGRAQYFTVADVLLFGAWFTGILALVYVPPSERLRRTAQALVDHAFPIPDQFEAIGSSCCRAVVT